MTSCVKRRSLLPVDCADGGVWLEGGEEAAKAGNRFIDSFFAIPLCGVLSGGIAHLIQSWLGLRQPYLQRAHKWF